MEKALSGHRSKRNCTGVVKKRAAGVSKTVPIKQIYVLSHIHSPFTVPLPPQPPPTTGERRGMCNMNFVF